MPEHDLRLLALDGGGVRGLSTLQIVKQLMDTIDPESPPKPCDYFDMIGGTSTGGLIAIMLGRLRMTVDECIDAYVSLSDRIFQKQRHRVTIRGQVQGRFDSDELERAIKEIVARQSLAQDALLKDDTDAKCKVFVCATSKETGHTVRLRSYRSARGRKQLLLTAKIWEAGRATSAASSFFDPITIGDFGESFVDGATGANNPVYELWNEAQDIWPSGSLEDKVKCLVSIGTGVPSLTPFKGDLIGIGQSLLAIVLETEKTAEQFSQDKSRLDDTRRYYRFNVLRGLEDIGLEDSKRKSAIIAATDRYIESQAVFKQVKACADILSGRPYVNLEDVLCLLAKAQAQAESGTSKLHQSLDKSKASEESMNTATVEFLTMLYRLLWNLGTPSVILQILDHFTGRTLDKLQAVINEDKAIVGGLQIKSMDARQTVEEMKEAEEQIRHYIEVSKRNNDVQSRKREETELRMAIQYSKIQETEQRIMNEAADLKGRKEYYAQLEEQVPRLQQEREALQQTVEQLKDKQAQLDDKIAKLEERQQEAERLRAESEGKSIWRRIWEWITWVLSFGN